MGFVKGYGSVEQPENVNPFTTIFKRIDETLTRKREMQREDEKDAKELTAFFGKLEKQHQYAKNEQAQKYGQEKSLAGLKQKGESNLQREKYLLENDYEDVTNSQGVSTVGQQPSTSTSNKRLSTMSISGIGNMLGKTKSSPAVESQPVAEKQTGKTVKIGDRFYAPSGKKLSLSFTPEEALAKVPKTENPDDYEAKIMVRNIKGVPTEIYTAQKRPEVIQGNKKIEQLKIEAETQEKEINSMIDSVWSKADELIPAAKTGRGGVLKGMERSYRASGIGRLFSGTEEGETAKAYKDYQQGTLSILIRALGEKGVLTNQDIQRSKDFEPKFGDSVILRKTKKDAMNEFLKSKVSAHYKTQGLYEGVKTQETQEKKLSPEERQELINKIRNKNGGR